MSITPAEEDALDRTCAHMSAGDLLATILVLSPQ